MTGAALDLTLVDLAGRQFRPVRSGQSLCRYSPTAPVEARAPEGSVDMGTGYDCSDVKAHTAASSITPAQRKWR